MLRRKAGVADPTSKSLGVAVLDFDNDGWPDSVRRERYAAQQTVPQ
jgi:hypothetical protein